MRKKSIYSPRYQLLVKMLREARLSANVTQAQVAERLERTESQISRWENCELRIDLRDLDEYLVAIGVDFVEFTSTWKRLADDLKDEDVQVRSRSQKRARPERQS
jgi:transcriptional regulator with XRE-family HTH domain